MAKILRGWRTPRDHDYKGDNAVLAAIDISTRSDDGWVCPHCGLQVSPEEAELSAQKFTELVHCYDPVDMCCSFCGKEYFVRCFTRFTYESCGDTRFKEE